MAETKTAEQVVSYLLEKDGADFLRESLRWVVQQLMEVEVSELIGAERGERAPEERLTQRNGYRPRRWTRGPASLSSRSRSCGAAATSRASSSRVGAQSRGWSPSCRRRTWPASRPGRSTRWSSRSRLRISQSEVSRICQGLDEQVEAFRSHEAAGVRS